MSFDRLLRWYPKAWREQHGAVMLGLWQDEAEADGRTGPTAHQRRAAFAHGVTQRLDLGFAFVAALIALVAAVAALALQNIFTSALPSGDLEVRQWAAAALAALSMTATGWVLITLMRRAGALSPSLTLATMIGFIITGVLGTFERVAFSHAWDVADGERAPSWLTRAEGVLMPTFFGFSIVLAAVVLYAVLRLVMPRIAAGAATAVIAIPLVLVAAYSSATGGPLIYALGAVVGVLVIEQRGRKRATVPLGPVTRRPRRRTPRGLVLALAVVALLIGTLGIAYALTGSAWGLFAGDSTRAMRLGMSIGFVGAIPLILALGLSVDARGWLSRGAITAAVALLCLAEIAIAIEWGTGDGSGNLTVLWGTATFLSSAAVGVVAGAAIPVRAPMHLLIGVASSLAVATFAFVGLPLTAFVVAPGALILIIMIGVQALRAKPTLVAA